MKTLAASRPLLWGLLALPGLWILARWVMTPDDYGYGHAIGDSGDWAVWLLMVTLAATPIRLLLRRSAFSTWLLRRRRDLGVASFAYAAGHTLIYLWQKGTWDLVVEEAASADILLGWLALALFLPLAITSNDVAMRAMRRSWKRLHRLVYPAAMLAFAHWVLAAFDPTTAYWHIAAVVGIELARIVLQARQRVT